MLTAVHMCCPAGLKQLRDKFTAWTGGIPSASIAWSTLSQQLPGLGFNMESQTIKGLADRLEGKQVTYDGLVIITMLCSVKEPQAIQVGVCMRLLLVLRCLGKAHACSMAPGSFDIAFHT